jgi:hypothetical protein
MFTASDEFIRRVTLAPSGCLRGSEVKSESHSVFIDTSAISKVRANTVPSLKGSLSVERKKSKRSVRS